jgi:segregation and condensation protein A
MSEARTQETYTIRLPQFEGPFDLLLFFIERDELDIHNIPIARITDDFLKYIHQLEDLDVDMASEFIVVAAQLMSIKARMLLPRKLLDEQGQEIDPRQELVDRLLEYKRYKSVLDEMRLLEEDRQFRNPRGFASEELRGLATKALVDVELESLTLFRLLQAFTRVMQRFEEGQKKQAVHQVVRWPYTIRDQQSYIRSLLQPGLRVSFEDLFRPCENRVHAIVTFLALLELLNQQDLDMVQGEGINQFWLTARAETEELPDLPEEEPDQPDDRPDEADEEE